jgi:hypothetical protein
MNLRSRYGDLPTRGEALQSGISGAINLHEQELEQDRLEANQMGAQGARRLPNAPNPGMMGRIRGIGAAIQRGIYGDDPNDPNVATSERRDGVAPILPGDLGTPRPSTRQPWDERMPDGSIPGLGGFGGFRMPPRPTTPQVTLRGQTPEPLPRPTYGEGDLVFPPAGGAPVPDAARGPQAPQTITDALAPDTYEYQGRRGARYEVDRHRAGREAYGLKGAESTQEHEIDQRFKDAHEQRVYEALAEAKRNPTPDNVAKARVLTNTVRYDEEYGQPRTTGMTFEQRQLLQSQRDAAAYRRAQLAASGRTNSAEWRAADLEFRRLSLQLQDLDRQINDVQKDIPAPGVPSIVAGSQPGGQAAIDRARQRVDSLNQERGRVLDRVRGTPTAPPAPRSNERYGPPRPQGTTSGRGATREQASARATELSRSGKTRVQIYEIMKREGYPVKPPREYKP